MLRLLVANMVEYVGQTSRDLRTDHRFTQQESLDDSHSKNLQTSAMSGGTYRQCMKQIRHNQYPPTKVSHTSNIASLHPDSSHIPTLPPLHNILRSDPRMRRLSTSVPKQSMHIHISAAAGYCRTKPRGRTCRIFRDEMGCSWRSAALMHAF